MPHTGEFLLSPEVSSSPCFYWGNMSLAPFQRKGVVFKSLWKEWGNLDMTSLSSISFKAIEGAGVIFWASPCIRVVCNIETEATELSSEQCKGLQRKKLECSGVKLEDKYNQDIQLSQILEEDGGKSYGKTHENGCLTIAEWPYKNKVTVPFYIMACHSLLTLCTLLYWLYKNKIIQIDG